MNNFSDLLLIGGIGGAAYWLFFGGGLATVTGGIAKSAAQAASSVASGLVTGFGFNDPQHPVSDVISQLRATGMNDDQIVQTIISQSRSQGFSDAEILAFLQGFARAFPNSTLLPVILQTNNLDATVGPPPPNWFTTPPTDAGASGAAAAAAMMQNVPPATLGRILRGRR